VTIFYIVIIIFMFSGIIQAKSKIISAENGNFIIENNFWKELEIWESIAHDGTCMTITSFDKDTYSFFTMQESLRLTNFSQKEKWSYFNVERSLKLNDAVNWHFVTGHIDTLWTITKIIKNSDDSIEIFTSFPKKFKNNIIDKWSITINWVSLTICKNWIDYLSVSIIPHTQDVTNLWLLEVWNNVNLEFDMIWKYINKIHSK
jgi:riboflavin synthase